MTVDGQARTMTTDASGRVELSGLKPGTHVKAVTTVDGERLESQDITIASSGIRVMLVATDPEIAKRAAEDRQLAKGPAAKGTVVFGPESRIIFEMHEDRLTGYYLFDIENSSRTPVDIGGPLMLDLPREARGASALDGSTKQATIGGTHVVVLGPFAPGTTPLQVAFELPYSGGTARVEQRMPAALPQVDRPRRAVRRAGSAVEPDRPEARGHRSGRADHRRHRAGHSGGPDADVRRDGSAASPGLAALSRA